MAQIVTVAWLAAASAFAATPAPVSPANFYAQLKSRMLTRINAERREFGLPPVKLDPLASHVADRFCAAQLLDRTVGHFATDGLAPYHRYSFSGGNDGLTENTAAWSSEKPYESGEIAGLIERSIDTMMAEAPPDDGHRRAILDRFATHVGLGIAWQGGEVRIAQEFLRRYLNWSAVPPRETKPGGRVVCSGTPVRGWDVAAASVHFEPFPRELARGDANRITNYELPAKRSDFPAKRIDAESELVRSAQEWGGTPGDLIVRTDRSFTFSIPFTEGPGIYTLVIWVRNATAGEPLVAASNVSIRVGSETTGGSAGAGRR